jgi:hypothetical protein
VDAVYICRDGDNEELRYSLRSVAANMPHKNVWVVGGKPDWYSGNFIEVRQDKDKYSNARANLRAIVECGDISPEFVLMNDDFYVLRKVDSVPYYHGGDLMDKIKTFEGFAAKSRYLQILWDTVHVLAYHGSPTTLDYAIHVPMRMEKENLGPLLGYEASIRTLYGNLFRVGGERIDDVKVHTSPRGGPEQYDYESTDFPFLSTADRTFWQVRKGLLKGLFPNPSTFEK